jgi:signal transduction histidine kinase
MVDSLPIQFRALLAKQNALQHQQQKRLARGIHDNVNQKLTLLGLQLSMATLAENPPANWPQKCQDWNRMVLEIGSALRDISNELRPRIVDDLGLPGALEGFASSCPGGVACKFAAPKEPVALAPIAANEMFALCRDIVSEVFAPNGVSEISIELEQADDLVGIQIRILSVKPGADSLTFQSLDLLSVHERLACVDGAAVVEPQPGAGFTVTLSVQTPRRAASAAA